MKKIISAFILLSIVISMFSCAASNKDEGISVVTTSFPIYSFVCEILGEEGNASLLLKPGQDSHSYEPSGKDILEIRNCDLFVCIGGHDEAWAKKLLNGKDLKNVTSLSLISAVYGEGDENGEGYDEHIWTSPKKAVIMVQTISDKLCEIFPDKADIFSENTEAYLMKLSALDASLTEIVKNAKRDTVVFADRFPFYHLTNDYGINYIAPYAGCTDMTEPSVSDVTDLISRIKNDGIKTVFVTPFGNGKLAKTVCDETGSEILTLHPISNITREEQQNKETYISIMEKNLEALKNALS